MSTGPRTEGLSSAARALIERRGSITRSVGSPPTPRETNHEAPLSPAQRRLWFLDRLAPGGHAYNVGYALKLVGALDIKALEASLQALLDRHEALRASFPLVAGAPVQRFTAGLRVPLEVEVLEAVDADAARAVLERRLAEETERPFDLGAGPLVRLRLFIVSGHESVVLLAAHHIVTDGWSEGILLRELGEHYRARRDDDTAKLSPLPIRYGDYAREQDAAQQSGEMADSVDWWVRRLQGAPPLELPTDHVRPGVQTFRGADQALRLSPDLVTKLDELAQRRGCTRFMVLIAVWAELLSRYTEQTDLVIGVPVAGRTRRELEGLVGLFVNTLPLRLDVSGAPTLTELLERVRSASFEAFARQDVPFDRLVEELKVERRPDRSPLAEVAFVLQSAPVGSPDLPGLQVSRFRVHAPASRFDLELHAIPNGADLRLRLVYAVDLFEDATIQRMLEHYVRLLEQIVADPRRPVADLDPLSSEEREQLLVEWNATDRPLPNATVDALVRDRAESSPDAVAVEHEGRRLTYRELIDRAGVFAGQLRAWGVAAGERVGIAAEPGIDLIVALLGTLTARAAYVPLDPAYPVDRLRAMVEDAQVTRVVAFGEAAESRLAGSGAEVRHARDLARGLAFRPGPSAQVFGSDRIHAVLGGVDSEVGGDPADLAYVIFTSGSTGRPKGVAVPHRAIVRLVWESTFAPLGPHDAVAQAATPAFDAATWEIWGALVAGARLVILDPDVVLSPRRLGDAIRAHRLTAMWLTSSLFNLIAREEPEVFTPLTYLLFGGEAADPEAVRRALSVQASTRFINGYGPTENTTFSTTHWVQDLAPGETVPIGRPIPNSRAYVLDARGRLAPVGVWGELFVGGAGVADGYIGQPELTAERFSPDPFADPGSRMYRTGDRVRWRPDGVLEFGGRRDGQVKLRGNRIELSEVEGALARVPAVRDAAAAIHGRGAEAKLVGYVVGAADQTDGKLRELMAAALPQSMIPTVFVRMEALPRTASGKLDRDALPAPGPAPAPKPGVMVPPRESLLAGQLQAIWEEMLGVPAVRPEDNFFDLGGHSLLAASIAARIERDLGHAIPLSAFLADPTVDGLTRWLARDAHATHDPLVTRVGPESGHAEPFFYFHGDLQGGGLYTHALSHQLNGRPILALHPHLPGGPADLEQMAAEHVSVIRREQPHGPYTLGGYCNGGVIAFEAARQLQQAGEEVRRLLVIDGQIRNAATLFAPLLRPDGSYGRFLGPLRKPIARFVRAGLMLERTWRWEHTKAEADGFSALVLWRVIKRGFGKIVNLATGRYQPAKAAALTPDGVALHLSQTEEQQIRNGFYVTALDRYVPGRFEGTVTLLVPEARRERAVSDLAAHWGSVARGVRVVRIPGDHLTAVTHHVGSLGSVISTVLDER